jgi:hypothetical protein
VLGGIPNVAPAMSAADINRSIWGNYSPQQSQDVTNNLYGPSGLGGQTAFYAGQGAAYGRGTGGFGGLDLPLKFHPVAIRVSVDVTPLGAV